jgi:flavin-dependent dehydrogenase
MKERITVIGAGPAGLSAAIVLAKHRYSVTVYDKSPDVGHRLNGDFQGLENWSSEEDVTQFLGDLGIDLNFLCVPYRGGIVFAPGISASWVLSDRPVFYLVRRGSMAGTLDAGLKEQALSLGVDIRFNQRVDADSLVGKAIVATGPRGFNAVAAGATFETDMEDSAAVVLSDGIAPKGYSYLLTNAGHGTMVAVLYREYGRVNECFGKTLKFFRKNLGLNMRNEKRFGSYGNFSISDSQIRGGKLYVGEAAGFQDCLWGFGMRYAILSGHLAAKSIMDGSDYDRLWKSHLKPMLETSLVNRYLFEKCGHAGYRFLARRFGGSHPCEFLRGQYGHSFFKHLLLPLARREYERRRNGRCVSARTAVRRSGRGNSHPLHS